jgi:lipoprotein-releasing system ATP-binding protein
MIEAHNLTKTYETPGESVRVLDGLDLTVAAGEAVAVVGPSGSGKTTLLNLLGALDHPSGGSLRIDGRELAAVTPDEAGRFRNRSLGFIFQQHYLLPQLSVLENVLVPRLAGGWEESAAQTEQRARDLLAKVGLAHRLGHLPWQLSGGEKLRVAVARALVNRPRLVLADEPTGLLDPAASDQVADLLMRLNREEGVTMVVVTHNSLLACRIGRTLELAGGKLKETAR